jgi:hypothetical protein
VLRIYPRCNQNTAIQFLDYLLAKLPFPVDVIQTDNGAEFATQFHYHVFDRGIRHVYIKPRTPRLNGKVERSHRIDAEEFYRMLDGVVIDDTQLFNDKLQEWEDFYEDRFRKDRHPPGGWWRPWRVPHFLEAGPRSEYPRRSRTVGTAPSSWDLARQSYRERAKKMLLDCGALRIVG